MADLPNPITREEQYLSTLAQNTDLYPDTPITREEQYLDYLCKNGIGGGTVTPEQIQAAVDQYLTENPVSGMTEEQIEQLNQATEDILKKVDIEQGVENAGKILTVGHDGIVTPVEMDETLTDNTKAAPAGAVGELKSDLTNLNIEGFNKSDYVNILKYATIIENQYTEIPSNVLKKTESTFYNTLVIDDVSRFRTIKAIGAYGFDIYPMVFTDEDDIVVSHFPIDRKTPITIETVETSVPSNAYRLYVPLYKSTKPVLQEKKIEFSFGEKLLDAINSGESISTIEIDGYSKEEYKDILGHGEFNGGKYVELVGTTSYKETNNPHYNYYKVPVSPGKKVKVYGAYGFDTRPVIFIDETDNLVSYYPTDRVTPIRGQEVTVDVPNEANYVLITETSGIKAECYENGYILFKKPMETANISVTIDKSQTLDVSIVSSIGTIVRQKLEVFNNTDQPNSAVLPRSVEAYVDGTWKTIVNNEDDNCPISLSSGYIGAGHGYDRARKLTVNSHGKTFADIGSTWSTGRINVYLVRILDENTLIFIGENADNEYDTNSFTEVSLTHVNGAVNTDDITASKNEAYLIAPVDKNHTKKILIDGKTFVSENGTYDADLFVDVIDEYDVINPQTIVSQIIANKPPGGYTENPPINTGDAFMHFSNIYRVLNDGTMLVITTVDNSCDVTLDYWGATQYAQKSSMSEFGGGLFRYVPKLLPIDGHDIRTPVNMSSWNFTVNADKEYWENPDSPPDRLLHLYTDGTGKYKAGFAVGYLPVAEGTPSVRKRNISNAMFLYQTMKAYFHLVDNGGENGNTWSAYTPFQSVAYRKPIFDLSNKHTSAYFVPNVDKCYMYADYHSVCDDRIKVPSEYVGKPIKVLEKSDNVLVYGSIATDEIRVRVATSSPMYGYAVVEIG